MANTGPTPAKLTITLHHTASYEQEAAKKLQRKVNSQLESLIKLCLSKNYRSEKAFTKSMANWHTECKKLQAEIDRKQASPQLSASQAQTHLSVLLLVIQQIASLTRHDGLLLNAPRI